MSPVVWLNVDEGYAAALGTRLLESGGLPYVDGISLRGPLMYWIYELALGWSDPFSLSAIRYGAVVSSLAVLLSVWCVALALRSPLAGGVGVLVAAWWLTVGWPPPDALAWNGEIIGLPFAVGSVAVAIWALRRPSSRAFGMALWIASGALAACAGFAKQSLGPHALWTAAWVALVPPGSLAVRLRRFALFTFGAATAGVAVLLPYTLTGHLGDFWYYFVVYGRDIYMAPVTTADVEHVLRAGILRRAPFNIMLAATALVLCVRAARRFRNPGAWHAASLWLLVVGHVLVAIPCATFTGRYFGHYFLQIDVFLSILVGLAVFGIAGKTRPGGSGLQVSYATLGAAAVGIAFIPLLLSGQNRNRENLNRSEWFQMMIPDQEPIGAWIRENTHPDDTVFIWGLRGDIYLNAHRNPASRFVYSLFPSGVVPWYRESLTVQEKRVVPGSQGTLLADLESSHAEIIVDGGIQGRYMIHYPMLRAYIQENYCLERVFRLFGDQVPVWVAPVYRRKGSGRPCDAIPSV